MQAHKYLSYLEIVTQRGCEKSCKVAIINPLLTIGNSLKKQKTLYKVLMPSINPPYKFLWELMTHICVIGW